MIQTYTNGDIIISADIDYTDHTHIAQTIILGKDGTMSINNQQWFEK
jgi:hypothetical protein